MHSPYSTESQGAQTDEYRTLSSQNYLMLGLMELYRQTGDLPTRGTLTSSARAAIYRHCSFSGTSNMSLK